MTKDGDKCEEFIKSLCLKYIHPLAWSNRWRDHTVTLVNHCAISTLVCCLLFILFIISDKIQFKHGWR